MNTNVKNITVELLCNNCLRKRTIYLCISMNINNLAEHIMNRKCLTCGKDSINVSHINFFYDSGHPLVGKK